MAKLAAEPSRSLPSDADLMNAFAAAYNDYVAGVQRGIVDLKKWQKVLNLWRKLNEGGSPGSCWQ